MYYSSLIMSSLKKLEFLINMFNILLLTPSLFLSRTENFHIILRSSMLELCDLNYKKYKKKYS